MLRSLTSRVVAPLSRQVGRRCMADFTGNASDMQVMRFEKSVNQVNLLGRLGRDAELRGSAEHPVVVFSMATNSVYTKQDGQTVSHVDWHRVSVFKPGLREKVAINLKKGDRVFVSGMLRYDEYVDSNENVQKSSTILASDLVNLTKRYLGSEDS
ncbi:single-stranded DNA-binding protein, mitochondrial-like [Haliotis cracherodii]|uniref:single-stranded DNA-binding protein, mitochondrial-like n=1 Tax=Haliotis cracherodii TaxID=6455 RepID=UPI0039E7E3D5